MIEFNQRVALHEDVIVREVEKEAVLLNLATQSYYNLNPVGARMLQLLTGSPSIEQAYTTLVSEYDADPQTLKNDLLELVEQLLAQGLVVLV